MNGDCQGLGELNTLTISFVLVRLVAVLLFVRALQGLSSVSSLLASVSATPTLILSTLTFGVALPIGIALTLWSHPEKLIGAQPSNAQAAEPISASQLLTVGISLLGLFALVYGIVDMFRIETAQFLLHRFAQNANLPNEAVSFAVIVSRATYAVQIIVGLALVLARNGLSDLLLRVKYAGTRPASAVVHE